MQKGIGATDEEAVVLAIIAMAESGGRKDAVNPTSGACGYWQHLPCIGTDAKVNARGALSKYRARGTQPWDASKSVWENDVNTVLSLKGDKKGLADKVGDIFGKVGGAVGDAIGGAGDVAKDIATADPTGLLSPLKAIAEFFVGATELLLTPEGWRRQTKIFLGGIILVVGINQLSKSMGGPAPVQRTTRIAKNVAGSAATGGTSTAAKVAQSAR